MRYLQCCPSASAQVFLASFTFAAFQGLCAFRAPCRSRALTRAASARLSSSAEPVPLRPVALRRRRFQRFQSDLAPSERPPAVWWPCGGAPARVPRGCPSSLRAPSAARPAGRGGSPAPGAEGRPAPGSASWDSPQGFKHTVSLDTVTPAPSLEPVVSPLLGLPCSLGSVSVSN